MPFRSRAQQVLDFAIPFIGVGAGAVTVVLFHDPGALIPRPPYIGWLFGVGALAGFSLMLAVGLEDGWAEDEEVDPAQRWRALAMAYLGGFVASLTFIGIVALTDRLN